MKTILVSLIAFVLSSCSNWNGTAVFGEAAEDRELLVPYSMVCENKKVVLAAADYYGDCASPKNLEELVHDVWEQDKKLRISLLQLSDGAFPQLNSVHFERVYNYYNSYKHQKRELDCDMVTDGDWPSNQRIYECMVVKHEDEDDDEYDYFIFHSMEVQNESCTLTAGYKTE